MNQTTTWDKVDQYITERLIPQDSVLEEVLFANQQAAVIPV